MKSNLRDINVTEFSNSKMRQHVMFEILHDYI